MWKIIKLIIYFYLYQVLFTALVTLPEIWTQLMNNGGNTNGFTGAKITITATCLALVLSGITMIWHLIHFKYVKFNLKSFGEVSGKTIALSIPLIVAGMIFANLCCEFLNLPDYIQATSYAMSRNVFGILSITVMAPLVEELLFRGAIQGHLLQRGIKPLPAILFSSAIFGLIHMNPIQIPFAFAIGLIFGWLYYRTGSLVPGIIGHFINNSIATLQMAMMTEEELNTKTIEWLGEAPTYALMATSLAVTIGMFLYLKKHLPVIRDYTLCHPEQSEKSETIHIVKEEHHQMKENKKAQKDFEQDVISLKIYVYISFLWVIWEFYEVFKACNNGGGVKNEALTRGFSDSVILLLCIVLMSFIIHNMQKKKIFVKANANLIGAIGVIVAVSELVHNLIIAPIFDVCPAVSQNRFSFIIGLFILFISSVFRIAIKMKEEQDLTI